MILSSVFAAAPFDRLDDGRPNLCLEPAALYAYGHLIRQTERLLLRLFEQGRLSGTTHTCIGQELCQMSVVRALSGPHDALVSNHRNHGHFLTYSGDFLGLVAEVMGREAGVCGGRGGSQHIVWRRFHSNGVQGGMTAIAAGHALATKRAGQRAVVAAMIGDGSLGQGLVYETLNLAAIWEVPLLMVVENNGIAQTTPTAQTTSGCVASRAAAFGLRYWGLDDSTADFIEQAAAVVEEVRQSGKAGMLEIRAMRLGPHSKGDDLRPQIVMEHIRQRDPLAALGAALSSDRRAGIEAQNDAYLEAVLSAAEASPEAQEPSGPRSVFSGVDFEHLPASATPAAAPNARTSLNTALRRLLEERQDIILLGEDMHDPYGGAFKVTASLSTDFPGRVISTPISEAGITGAGIGLALDGWRPIVEVMFADFTSLAFDQLYNHAVKFPVLSSHARVPLIVRTPAGGRRGYGPTHSQSPEHYLTSVPGLTVVMPSHRHDPGALLRTIVDAWPMPTVFLEHKLLYSVPVDPAGYRRLPNAPDDPASHLFPTLARGPAGADLTLVSFGGMATVVEEAARYLEEEEELAVEILLPCLLAPLPRRTLTDYLGKRRYVVLAEESHTDYGVSAEIAASLAEAGFRGRLTRVGAPPAPIPAARSLESQVLPGWRAVVTAALALFEA